MENRGALSDSDESGAFNIIIGVNGNLALGTLVEWFDDFDKKVELEKREECIEEAHEAVRVMKMLKDDIYRRFDDGDALIPCVCPY